MKKDVLKLIVGFAGMVCVSAAQAIPVQWHLRAVVFNDGSTASGSFYDADINLYSGINITTSTKRSTLCGNPHDWRPDWGMTHDLTYLTISARRGGQQLWCIATTRLLLTSLAGQLKGEKYEKVNRFNHTSACVRAHVDNQRCGRRHVCAGLFAPSCSWRLSRSPTSDS